MPAIDASTEFPLKKPTPAMHDTAYEKLKTRLLQQRYTWLVTGAAGFIGSHLVETLLTLGQKVVALDNYSTGRRANIEELCAQWPPYTQSLSFIEGDIRTLGDCHRACAGVDYVLHQAALGSVPRSIDDPVATNANNIDGFLNMLIAAREAGVQRFVYASSSAVYGDHPALPKIESVVGRPLSPYAATKHANELYADAFARSYNFNSIGLRYFNIFGPRQDPEGAYAAVIPKWVASLLTDETVYINGDGQTSRDFCYIDNAVQANLLAATTEHNDALNQAYNIAVQARTTLNELFELIRGQLQQRFPAVRERQPVYREFRAGDVAHSHANIDKAKRLLGYVPSHDVQQGLVAAMDWYIDYFQRVTNSHSAAGGTPAR